MHIILVHGAGGSGYEWSLVEPALTERGWSVSVVENASRVFDDDVAAVTALIDAVEGPTLLVAHSYGGAVITTAGLHDRVVGLVYVAAFAPTAGESVWSIGDDLSDESELGDETVDDNGDWAPTPAADFVSDVPPHLLDESRAHHRIPSQEIFLRVVQIPAWRSRPSWYIVAERDEAIPPRVQRIMAERAGSRVSTVDTSHAVPLVAPRVVVAVVSDAVAACREATAI